MLPHGWVELVALLGGAAEVDPMSMVRRLCALCLEVTGATGAALSIASDGRRSTVCATDDMGDRLEELQDVLGEGPTIEALRSGRSVMVDDLAASDGRWPAFTPAAHGVGVRAVFVFPLRMGAIRIGALALYRNEAGSLDDERFRDAWVVADAATVLLMLSSPGNEPGEAAAWALGDESRFRPEVHQAVGITMVHLDTGPRDAFARMCAHAFATDTPIGEVAVEIVARRLRLEADRSV